VEAVAEVESRRGASADEERREQAAARAEVDLLARELELNGRVEQVEAQAAALAGKVDVLRRQASALAQGQDVVDLLPVMRRLEALQPSRLATLPERERALVAREQVVRTRAEAAERIRKQVEDLAAWMGRAQQQLGTELMELRRVAGVMDARRKEEAERARREQEQAAAVKAAQVVKAQERPPAPAVVPVPVQKAGPPGMRPAAARPPPPPAKALQPVAPPRAASARMQTRVDMGSDSNFYAGFSGDVSQGGGLFVATLDLVPPGTPVELRFTLPDGACVDARGVVRWVRDVLDETPEIFPGVGVQLLELPRAAQGAINQFVARREAMFYPEPS
ncbi:MAG TPA: TIGR02266 family protein, partial [Myxococcales bacterium]|nr:TIGR02266 family protein [Myxococcales bacterium]